MPRNAGKKNKNKKTNAVKKQTKPEIVNVEEVEEKEVAEQEDISTKKETNTKKEVKSKKTIDKKQKKHFLKDFRAELKKVNWPTPKNLFNNVVAVLVIVVIMALLIFLLDLGFDLLNKQGVNRLKNMVDSNNSIVNTVDNENTMSLNDATVSNEEQTNTSTDINVVDKTE